MVWPMVALIGAVVGSLTLLLALHVPVVDIAIVTGFVSPLISALLYMKLNTIEKQTNGASERKDALIEGFVEHLKTHTSVPTAQETTKPDGE